VHWRPGLRESALTRGGHANAARAGRTRGDLPALSNGAAEILRRVYGEGGHTIRLTNPFTPAVANLQFDYSTFNEVCDDVDDARVFGGIHYRFDQVAGSRLGREIATSVYKNNLRKAKNPK